MDNHFIYKVYNILLLLKFAFSVLFRTTIRAALSIKKYIEWEIGNPFL